MTDQKRKIYFLIFDDVEILDVTGPYDVFSMTNVSQGREIFELLTVSPDGKPSRALHGMTIAANFSVANCPITKDDMLVIPGGRFDLMPKFDNRYPDTVKWIARQCDNSAVISICLGALVLAQADILDELKVTTHHGALKTLKQQAPKAHVIPGVRYVDNGKTSNIFSSAGVTAGIDLAFYLVRRMLGREAAEKTALLMEYNGTSNWLVEQELG